VKENFGKENLWLHNMFLFLSVAYANNVKYRKYMFTHYECHNSLGDPNLFRK